MIVPRDRGSLVQELLVAEVLARRGQGPLAKKHWPRPRPRPAGDSSAAEPERPDEPTASAPERDR